MWASIGFRPRRVDGREEQLDSVPVAPLADVVPFVAVEFVEDHVGRLAVGDPTRIAAHRVVAGLCPLEL